MSQAVRIGHQIHVAGQVAFDAHGEIVGPDPPVPVTFNFDQGIAAEETFPMEELEELTHQVLHEDGARALEYISFGYDEGTGVLEYLPSYIELVLGYTGLREQVAAWLAKR